MPVMRLVFGLSLGLVVTLGLMLMMPALIKTADKPYQKKEVIRISDITMPDRTIEAHLKEFKPEKPDNPEEPPPDLMPPDMQEFDINPDALNLAPQTRMDLNLGTGNGIGSSDGEFLPIVKVAPMYPRRANTRGIEGYCTVEYTVTKTGAVKGVRAVDCTPPGFFERVSVKAAAKFKYKPRVIDGEPVDVEGVRNRFTFELEQ